MKRLHRYLLAELLQNASLTVVAILAIFFMLALALVLGTSKSEGVPFLLVMRHTGFKAVSTLYLTLPLTVLTASLFTYGRARSDGEFTATRVAGIHPWQTILPAVLLGSLCTLALCWLQGEAMPAAHFRSRVELSQNVLESLEDVLKQRDRRIERPGWSARWETLRSDDEGHIVLGGLHLLLFERDGDYREDITAEWAKPRLDMATNTLTLELTNLKRELKDGQQFMSSSFSVPLQLGSRRGKRKRDGDCSYEELLTRSRRYAQAATTSADEKVREKMGEKALEYAAEYHKRIAFSFSSLLFAFLGAALGLWRGMNNRALVFLTGFLIVVGLYYPLEMIGAGLAVGGVLPPAIAMWIGNVAMLGLSGWIFRRVLRP